MLWTSNLTTVTRPWQESRKPSTTVTKSSIFDLAGDLNSPLGVWLWKNYSVLLKNLYLQLCWSFKHLICSAGKPSLEEFLEHWSTGVSDVIITWLWRRKRLSRHPHLFFSLPLFCQCFWTDWQNVFSNFCPIAALTVCDQDRSQQYDMSCAFNPCLLQINSNGRLKQEHLEFSSSATKNIIFPLPQCRWLPNLAGWWLTKKGYHPLNYMTL